MTYYITIEGQEELPDGTLKPFREVIESKSPKEKNWRPKLREKLGKKIDFDKIVWDTFRWSAPSMTKVRPSKIPHATSDGGKSTVTSELNGWE